MRYAALRPVFRDNSADLISRAGATFLGRWRRRWRRLFRGRLSRRTALAGGAVRTAECMRSARLATMLGCSRRLSERRKLLSVIAVKIWAVPGWLVRIADQFGSWMGALVRSGTSGVGFLTRSDGLLFASAQMQNLAFDPLSRGQKTADIRLHLTTIIPVSSALELSERPPSPL